MKVRCADTLLSEIERAAPPARALPDAVEELEPGRAIGRQVAQEIGRELVEVFGDPGRDAARRRDHLALLLRQDLHERAVEGDLARQGLVQHDAHGVVIGFGSDELCRGLLGRHVVEGADDRGTLVRGELLLPVVIHGQPEVEDHHAAPRA
jgi:hypothetical protein